MTAFNPHGKPITELPVIYGFNNGGSPGFMIGELIAEDGTFLGSHCCSHECYMPGDLGILEGARKDRHERFRAHYPDGYRMAFVGYDDVDKTPGLLAAFEKNKVLETASGTEAGTGETEGLDPKGDGPTGEAGDAPKDIAQDIGGPSQ